MFRVIFLFLFSSQLGFAQNQTIKLTYKQIVSESSAEEKSTKKVGSILTSFQPILLSMVESTKNLTKVVFVEQDKIYIENYLLDQEGIFSSKIEKDGNINYINKLTGEKKLLKIRNLAYSNYEIPTKFKLKNKGSSKLNELEIYKAENKDMLIEYHVSAQLKFNIKSGLSEEFLYDNKVILKSIKYVKKEDKRIINELVSLDTLENESLREYLKLIQKEKSQVANQRIGLDSIEYNQEIPDIFINLIGKDEIVSLNKYKGNGKYLLVDFWGTWCTPCLASIPELKSFYDEYVDQIDLIALNYSDHNEVKVKSIIEQYQMDWDHGSVSEKVLKILNPKTHFPGVLLFDDKMRLIVRDRSKSGLIKIKNIIDK